MVRYYTIAIDMADGSDTQDEIFNFRMVAKARFDKIKLSANGIVYKSLTMTTDKGEVILARESYEGA